MRKLSFIFASLLLVVTMYAQDLKAIKLSSPDKNRGSSIMKALSDRHSDREYAAKELSLQDLSDLLWAANGINRPDGKRTAPSALNKQDIDIYVIMKEGAYLYDAKANSLQPIAKGKLLIQRNCQTDSRRRQQIFHNLLLLLNHPDSWPL